jgi:pyruvate-formate lyase-activating enzyme
MKTKNAVVMVTRRCNMTCAHCSVESNPHIKLQPDEDELRHLVDRLVAAKVRVIQFTGGEPMLRADLVMELMRRAKAHGIPSIMVSNGFWGKKPEKAASTLKKLLESGLTRLAISYDRFHAEFQGPEPVLNILDAVGQLDWTIHINITRTADDSELEDIVKPFKGIPHAHLRFYDIQPVGLAKNLKDELRAQIDGFCSACEQATFTDNGRVLACNGPAYFEKMDSPLVVGEYRSGRQTVEELLTLHAEDPILEAIRVDGPLVLKETLERTPGFEDYPFQSHYSGMCELCLQINQDPRAVAALRAQLGQPFPTAERLARRLVRDEATKTAFHRHAINFHVAPMAFLKLLIHGASDPMGKVFGRADVDWQHQVDLLERTGLLHLMQRHHKNSLLTAWTPKFFWTRVGQNERRFEADKKGRLENLHLILQLANEHGFSLKPWGATQLTLWGNPRIPDQMTFGTCQPTDQARETLSQRTGLPFLLLHSAEQGLSDPARVALETFASWYRRNFRGGSQAAWDLAFLSSREEGVDWDAVQSAAERHGLGFALHMGRAVLAEELEWSEPEHCQPQTARMRFGKKIIRYQMSRGTEGPDNMLLGPLLPLIFAQGPTRLPEAGLVSLTALARELLRLWKTAGLGGARKVLQDAREALQAVGALPLSSDPFYHPSTGHPEGY